MVPDKLDPTEPDMASLCARSRHRQVSRSCMTGCLAMERSPVRSVHIAARAAAGM